MVIELDQDMGPHVEWCYLWWSSLASLRQFYGSSAACVSLIAVHVDVLGANFFESDDYKVK